jgi:hypothetical protein
LASVPRVAILRDVQEVFTSLVKQTNKIGLKMNLKRQIFDSIMKNLTMKTNMCKWHIQFFEIVQDNKKYSKILTNKNELRPDLKETDLRMQIEHIMHFYLY